MKNVDMKIVDKKLIITVDLGKEFGLSSSQKNIIIATTEGNQSVPGAEEQGVKIGLNVYKKK
ncbi:MAG TPA: hypothetical protein PK668_08745 [Myxococcota bacterium]|nr:hypothetical protein [Myxococcota bacterium]HRY92934.1 hypothetical protein [Myxococcota bacterium]HSA19847.1 hypothetical protein [Myxococcota bacterium]